MKNLFFILSLALTLSGCGRHHGGGTPATNNQVNDSGNVIEGGTNENGTVEELSIECDANDGLNQDRTCYIPEDIPGEITSITNVEIISQADGIECLKRSFGLSGYARAIRAAAGCHGIIDIEVNHDVKRVTVNDNFDWLQFFIVRAFDFGDLALNESTELGQTININRLNGDLVLLGKTTLGVRGGHPVPDQINHDATTNESQGLVIHLQEHNLDIWVGVSRLFPNEAGAGGHEQAMYSLLDKDGKLIEKDIINKDSRRWKKVRAKNNPNHVGKFRIVLEGKGAKYLVLSATGFANGKTKNNDSSDYFVDYVTLRYLDI